MAEGRGRLGHVLGGLSVPEIIKSHRFGMIELLEGGDLTITYILDPITAITLILHTFHAVLHITFQRKLLQLYLKVIPIA